MESLDRDTWYTRMHAGEKDGTSAFLGSSSMVGLKWFFYPENIPWSNWGRVNDTELVETFEAGMTSLDTEVAAMYFKEFQKIIVENGYWNPLYYDTNVKLSHKTVKGLKHPLVGEGWIFLDVEVTG